MLDLVFQNTLKNYWILNIVNKLKSRLSSIGPGSVVAAAFIGPGTITMCSISGAKFGYSLIWALFVSIFITIIIQLTAVRIGVVTRKSLSELLRVQLKNKLFKLFSISLLISAIFIGNAAYEAGNITGSVIGLKLLFDKNIEFLNLNIFSLITGLIAFAII